MHRPRPRLALLCGFLVAAALASQTLTLPRAAIQTLDAVLAFSFAVPAITLLLAGFTIRLFGKESAFIQAAHLLWLIPFALLAGRNSIWAPGAAILVALASWTLLHRLRAPRPATNSGPSGFFAQIPPLGWRTRLSALLLALMLQTVTVALGLQLALTASLLLILLIWAFALRGTSPPPPASHARQLHPQAGWAHGFGAILLTLLAAMAHFGVFPGRPFALRASAVPVTQESGPANAGAEETNVGIILIPEEAPSILVIPPRITLQPASLTPEKNKPLEIPFAGVYWLYRSPHRSPPAGSLTRQGSPDKLRFRSNDLRRLNMEARQNLAKHLDLSCCTRIEVRVRNADPATRPTGLELILADTATGETRSLGQAPLRPTQLWTSRARTENQTLTFAVPADARAFAFDEFRFVFHLEQFLRYRSAMVAIDRIVLSPI